MLRGVLYEWPVDRHVKAFRGGVIEVGRYAPGSHARLFQQVLSALTTGYIELVGTDSRTKATLPQLDLVTFPEAFLPLAALDETLRRVGSNAFPAFIHVGLRRDATDGNHLVPVSDVSAFVNGLLKDGIVSSEDLREVGEWLDHQPADAQYNLGCVFGVDANGGLRVCLHPKVVRSKSEEGALRHEHMTEANLLSIVNLDPVDRNLMPVYVQPLLCSDALVIPMDRPTNHHPLLAITSRVAAFRRSIEHIDVVSIASCTRQSSDTYPDGSLKHQWQHEFRDSAKRIAKDDDARCHHGAIILKANYGQVQGILNAGLSGFFFPHALQEPLVHAHVHQSVYAKTKSDESRWLANREVEELRKDWKNETRNRGYIVALADVSAQASLLAFEVTRLSRDARGWGVESSLRRLRVFDLVPGNDSGADVFVERGI